MSIETKMAIEDRRQFPRPPIIEVAMCIYFVPVNEVKAQHVGTYWESIREEYPDCQQQIPVFPAPAPQEAPPQVQLVNAPGEIFPLPRFWFTSEKHPHLIQMQRNAFLFNWRRRPEDSYNGYEIIEANFWKEFVNFKNFVESTGGKIDVIERCELVYVDLVPLNKFFTKRENLGEVFPQVRSLCEPPGEEWQLRGFNASVSYLVNENLSIDTTTKLGRRTDTQEVVSQLELKAYGVAPELSVDAAHGWFTFAHESLNRLFLELTDERVQNEVWGQP
jgi:uncharacterized protein (TIGR04255 family)